jgi:hypothetical protein
MTLVTLNLDRLLKLRLIVARFGEMDLARWWNTRGQLGRHGAAAIRRGFPRTHYFAQARSVFAVAALRERNEPMDIVIIGIDLGKNSCSVAGMDALGRVVLRRRMR